MGIDGRRVGIANAKTALWVTLGSETLDKVELRVRVQRNYPELMHRFEDALFGLIRDRGVVESEDGTKVCRNLGPVREAFECPGCGRVYHVEVGKGVPWTGETCAECADEEDE